MVSRGGGGWGWGLTCTMVGKGGRGWGCGKVVRDVWGGGNKREEWIGFGVMGFWSGHEFWSWC